MNISQARIDYKGDLNILLAQVSYVFDLGDYKSHKIIPIGYEDFNLLLETINGVYFVKIFASFRDEDNCKRYIDVIREAISSGVSHPLLYKSKAGYLYKTFIQGSQIRLCVMEYIKGKSFYETKEAPSPEDIKFITEQVAMINKMKLKPATIYDNWAVTNFLEQFNKKNKYLNKNDLNYIEPLTRQFKSLNLKKIQHCFVHGDITKTNTIKNQEGKIKIIDFAVSNYYPRIMDLAALFSDLFFDQKHMDNFLDTYKFVLNEYQKYIPLPPDEIKLLPTIIKLTHVMHVLCATYEKAVLRNTSEENEYYLNTGRLGLKYLNTIWND